MSFSPIKSNLTHQNRTNHEVLVKKDFDTQKGKEKLGNDKKVELVIQKAPPLAPEKTVETSLPNSKILELQCGKEGLVCDPVGVELLAGTGENGSKSERVTQHTSDGQNTYSDSDGCDDCCCDDVDCSSC